jgi:hypothetical protein
MMRRVLPACWIAWISDRAHKEGSHHNFEATRHGRHVSPTLADELKIRLGCQSNLQLRTSLMGITGKISIRAFTEK